MAQVKAEFEIAQPVQAELYKLLLYEPGGFFVPHRDTEKARDVRDPGDLLTRTSSRWRGCKIYPS